MPIQCRDIPPLTSKDILRFWSKVRWCPLSPDVCWEWTAGRIRNGYGWFQLQGQSVLAHRVAASLSGVDGDGPLVLHRCDNPPCCNPNHLFYGTDADNSKDKLEKGRARCGGLWGETNPSHKLRSADVVEIRRLAAVGELHRVIAIRFGVTRKNVGLIVRRKTWRNVT